MAATTVLGRADPDAVVDKLPFPYRLIHKALTQVLGAVADHIDFVEKERRSSEREFGLTRITPTRTMAINSKVTTIDIGPASARWKAPWSFAIGTSEGEALLVDANRAEVVASKRPFPEGEGVHAVALCMGSTFKAAAPPPGQRPQQSMPPRQPPRLFVAGSASPRIVAYTIVEEGFGGTTLSPSCSIKLGAGTESSGSAAPPVAQLHAHGIEGATWVVALQPDGIALAYLCPLGPVVETGSMTNLAQDTIPEEKEGEPEQSATGGDEFQGLPSVSTASYSINLSLTALRSSMPSVPDPAVESLHLVLLGVQTRTASAAAGGGPTYLLAASKQSSVLSAFCLQGMKPIVAPPSLEIDALLKQVVPAVGAYTSPTETLSLEASRRWVLPACITATAASPSGWSVAVGTQAGSMALLDMTLAASLRRTLPGHYGACVALSFYKEEILVSLGADGWVHHYGLVQESMLFRCLLSPPPAPPAMEVAVSQHAPMSFGMDEEGNIRFFDLRRGRKAAKVAASAEQNAPSGLQDYGTPTRLIAPWGGSFVVLCEESAEAGGGATSRGEDGDAEGGPQDPAQPPPSAGRAVSSSTADAAKPGSAATSPGTTVLSSQLVFFNMEETLQQLYSGIAMRVQRQAQDPLDLFGILTEEEIMEAPLTKPVRSYLPTAALPDGGGLRKSAVSSTGGPADLAGSQRYIVSLTAENLQRMGARGTTASGGASPGGRVGGGAGAGGFLAVPSSTNVVRMASKLSSTLQTDMDKTFYSAPENWQAATRRGLRHAARNKEARLNHVAKRMDVLRKELEAN